MGGGGAINSNTKFQTCQPITISNKSTSISPEVHEILSLPQRSPPSHFTSHHRHTHSNFSTSSCLPWLRLNCLPYPPPNYTSPPPPPSPPPTPLPVPGWLAANRSPYWLRWNPQASASRAPVKPLPHAVCQAPRQKFFCLAQGVTKSAQRRVIRCGGPGHSVSTAWSFPVCIGYFLDLEIRSTPSSTKAWVLVTYTMSALYLILKCVRGRTRKPGLRPASLF